MKKLLDILRNIITKQNEYIKQLESRVETLEQESDYILEMLKNND